MKAQEIVTESRSHPVIVVDVQPAYCECTELETQETVCRKIVEFVGQQTGPVLMFFNADETGMTSDNIHSDIIPWWNDVLYEFDLDELQWSTVEIVDKGFGYLRSWMDSGVNPAVIIRVIREMYAQGVSSSTELYGGADQPHYVDSMQNLTGKDLDPELLGDPLYVQWTSVAQLKRFSGAYLVGGARNECLRELELLMNAFNIRYRRIDSLVYG